jgi:hypothetical protein
MWRSGLGGSIAISGGVLSDVLGLAYHWLKEHGRVRTQKENLFHVRYEISTKSFHTCHVTSAPRLLLVEISYFHPLGISAIRIPRTRTEDMPVLELSPTTGKAGKAGESQDSSLRRNRAANGFQSRLSCGVLLALCVVSDYLRPSNFGLDCCAAGAAAELDVLPNPAWPRRLDTGK